MEHNYETLIADDNLSGYIIQDDLRFRLLIDSIDEAVRSPNRFDPNPIDHFPRIYNEEITLDDVKNFVIIMRSSENGNSFLTETIDFFTNSMKRDIDYREAINLNNGVGDNVRDKEIFLKLLYFFVFYSTTSVERVYTHIHTIGWKVDTLFEKKTQFDNIPGEELTLFHGTGADCVYSILRNSLKNCSGTDLMRHGACSGNGIYLAKTVEGSLVYSHFGISSDWKFILVVRAKNLNTSNGTVYVQQPEDILICGLICTKTFHINPNIINAIIESNLKTEIKKEIKKEIRSDVRQLSEPEVDTLRMASYNGEFLSSESLVNSGRFRKEMSKIFEIAGSNEISRANFQDPTDVRTPLLIEIIPSEGSKLKLDCQTYGIPGIVLAFYFMERMSDGKKLEYPFVPPIVRVVKPKFLEMTGRVTNGGSICVDMLYPNGWEPTRTIESLCIALIDVVSNGDGIKCGRIDKNKLGQEYTFEEFQTAFTNIGIAHRWKVLI